MSRMWRRITKAVRGCDHLWIPTRTIHGVEFEECPKCLGRRVAPEPPVTAVEPAGKR